MSHRSNFGKLIISRYYDYYLTYHDLKLILIKGNGNEIDIDNKIRKLVINGNNNKITINPSGKVGQIKLRGNNNIISSNFFNSFNNAVDYGHGNNVYIRRRRIRQQTQSSDDEDENENTDNEDDIDDEEEDLLINEYRRRRDLNLMIAQLRRLMIGNLNSHTDSNSDEENSEEEENLYDLIDISFKKAPIGIKDENEKCVICFENFIHNESIKMTNCFHIFHHECIKKWIKSKEELDETPDCPICRREL